MNMLEKAYLRVSKRHGGLTRGQILDHYGPEVRSEIDQIAGEYLVMYILAVLSLLLVAIVVGNLT